MKLNISQVLEYQFCPVSWQNKYVTKRVTTPSPALKDGTYWHKLAEAWLKRDPLLPAATGPVQDRMRRLVEGGELPLYPTVGVEVVLEMPLGRHTLVGTLDGIMPCEGGKFYSLQWKTCSGGEDLARQCDKVKYSYYEAAYEALMNHNGYPCAGTFLGVYKKLTKHDLGNGVQPYSAHVLERPAGYVARIMNELEMYADRMSTDLVMPARRNCIQGFMRCAYFDSCYNDAPLTDLRYSDAEDRYSTTEEQ